MGTEIGIVATEIDTEWDRETGTQMGIKTPLKIGTETVIEVGETVYKDV